MDALARSLPEDQRAVFGRQVEVARAGLSRVMIASAKQITNHTLWERHITQNQLNASDLILCDSKDKATMRTLPIDSASHLFGSQHARVADIIKSRKEKCRPTMTVRVDPGLVFKPQQAKGSGGKSKG